ncbi:MAG TPA: protein kinase [Clostridiales bacterium]|nr:protein kinase [Clostridiales bacterium]
MTEVHLPLQDVISGRWNKNTYRILRLLGRGGIGTVYQVKDEKTGEIAALKISQDLQSLTKEYKMLKKFQHLKCVPKVKEMDDFLFRGKFFHYIVMEYIDGITLKAYIKRKPMDLFSAAGLILVIGRCFQEIHKNQLAFGDLKLDNIMIDSDKRCLKIIDWGGVTPIGSSIKEFTPVYDRASWDKGIRTADAEYDLFSLSMLFAVLLLGREIQPNQIPFSEFIGRLREKKIPVEWVRLIQRGLEQRNISFEMFIREFEKLYKKKAESFKIYLKDRINIAVNFIFIMSILFCIGVLSILFGKRFNF